MTTIFILEKVDNPKFPYRLTIRRGDKLLLALRVQDRWPGQKGNIFCLREEAAGADGGDWEPSEAEIDRVPVVSLRRYGRRLALVLDRAKNKRCDFLFLAKRYKNRDGEYEQIFWRTEKALRQNRPKVKLSTYRSGELSVIIDSSERYPWRFPDCAAERGRLPVGDYALQGERALAAVVERKTFDNLLAEFARMPSFHQQLGELTAYRHSALVVEARYSDFLSPAKLTHYPPAFTVKALAELHAFHPELSIVFAGNRKLANEWTLRFFAAVSAHQLDAPHDKVAEALVFYGTPPAAFGGVYFEIKDRIVEDFPSRFTIAMVREVFADAPEHTIRRALNELRKGGFITSRGRGKASFWEKAPQPVRPPASR